MNNEKALIAAPAMTETQLVTVLENSLYPGAAASSISLVLNYCKAAGLDPMMKPVHIVPIWDSKLGRMRDTIMPGIGLYRTQAARSGLYAGMTEPEFGDDITETIGGATITYPKWCRVTVKRDKPGGGVAEFTAKELWKENYAVKGGKDKSIAPNAMWTRRPYAQLAKCASAQALRAAFPELTGAAPTAEEMEGKDIDGEAIAGTATRVPDEPAKPAEAKPAMPATRFDKAFPKYKAGILDGTGTAEDCIAQVESKWTLTEAQKKAIRDVKPEPKGAAVDPADQAGPSRQQILDQIISAKDMDSLAIAADLIRTLADEGAKAELNREYQAARNRLESAENTAG